MLNTHQIGGAFLGDNMKKLVFIFALAMIAAPQAVFSMRKKTCFEECAEGCMRGVVSCIAGCCSKKKVYVNIDWYEDEDEYRAERNKRGRKQKKYRHAYRHMKHSMELFGNMSDDVQDGFRRLFFDDEEEDSSDGDDGDRITGDEEGD